MGEEFQESEVIFPDPVVEYGQKAVVQKTAVGIHIDRKSSSEPVRIPYSLPAQHCWEYMYYDDDGVVPPHVIVARRVEAKTACSFYALKGRNLSRVRNCILRMTGFLEA